MTHEDGTCWTCDHGFQHMIVRPAPIIPLATVLVERRRSNAAGLHTRKRTRASVKRQAIREQQS